MTTSKRGSRPVDPAEIAESVMKGWKTVSKPRFNADLVDAAGNSDSQMPSTKTLKDKWFGSGAKVDSMPASVDDAGTTNVVLESGPLEKTVGVNKGKVIWRQG